MMTGIFFSRIDNSPLIIFRIFFGILISLECYGAILTGWVRTTLVEPDFTFAFIGFEWLQPLPGIGMYLYFILMGTLGILIAVGYRYRMSIITFTLLWTAAYLMQKSAYNNHYYLLVLISGLMCFFPANSAYSLDARKRPGLRKDTMYAYVKWIVIGQLMIVYTCASVAKLYSDWMDFSFISLLMESKKDYFLIGPFLQLPLVHKAIGLFGVLFDLLVVPLLLYKPTRKWAFVASMFFHLFNSLVFQIGIFPYLSLAFTVFFFEGEQVRKSFILKKSKPHLPPQFQKSVYPHLILAAAGLYLTLQLMLPLRHHFIRGDVLWTEEGHRLSWRMMLRNRVGNLSYRIVDKETGGTHEVRLEDWLTKKQMQKVKAYPDFAWQFSKRLKHYYAALGQDVGVFVSGSVKINRHLPAPLIDPETDLGSESWDPFRHHSWILPSPLRTDYAKKPGSGQ